MGLIVQINEDCSFSPAKEFIRDLNVAFADGDIDFIKEHVSDEIVWEVVGSWKAEGKEAFVQKLKDVKDSRVQKLYLDCIISYDDRASSNGIIYMENGRQYSFADVFRFRDTVSNELSSITSYMIETSPEV